jgi:DNA-binding MarR family transcriptional regulator
MDGDRRVTVAKLTKHGREVFAGMAKAHEGWLRELMGDVDDETLGILLKQLATVKSSASRRLVETSDD